MHAASWLDDAVKRARPALESGLGVAGWLKRANLTAPVASVAAEAAPAQARAAYAFLERCISEESTRKRLLSAGPVTSLRRAFGAGAPDLDVVYVIGGDPDGFTCIVAAARARKGSLERHQRQSLRHLAARIDFQCRVMTNSPTSLRDLVTRPGTALDADVAWAELLAGDLSPIDSFDLGARRYIIARRGGSQLATAGRLSRRELTIVRLVARGHANKRIAYELGVAEQTVATHLTRARAKLGVRTRLELIALFAGA